MRVLGAFMVWIVTLNLIVQIMHPYFKSMSFNGQTWVGAAELVIPLIAAAFAWKVLR